MSCDTNCELLCRYNFEQHLDASYNHVHKMAGLAAQFMSIAESITELCLVPMECLNKMDNLPAAYGRACSPFEIIEFYDITCTRLRYKLCYVFFNPTKLNKSSNLKLKSCRFRGASCFYVFI